MPVTTGTAAFSIDVAFCAEDVPAKTVIHSRHDEGVDERLQSCDSCQRTVGCVKAGEVSKV